MASNLYQDKHHSRFKSILARFNLKRFGKICATCFLVYLLISIPNSIYYNMKVKKALISVDDIIREHDVRYLASSFSDYKH